MYKSLFFTALLIVMVLGSCGKSDPDEKQKASQTKAIKPQDSKPKKPEEPILPPPDLSNVTKGVPKAIDPKANYLFYLHGAIVESEGKRPKHSTYGYYEYERILEALAKRGFKVISERRPKGTKSVRYAEKVTLQVK